MAWDLRGNYTQELDRARIVASVKDPARVEQLYPAYPYAEHSPIIPSGDHVRRCGTAPASTPRRTTAAQRAAHRQHGAQRATAAATIGRGSRRRGRAGGARLGRQGRSHAVPAMLGGPVRAASGRTRGWSPAR